MSFTVSITIPGDPTPQELRKAKEVLALLKSMSNAPGRDAAETDDDDMPSSSVFSGAPLPVGAVAPPPPAAVALEFDVTNLPWDARIHSGTKGKNKDGSWKARKNLDDVTKTAVTTELRAVHSAPVAPPPTAVAPPPPPATLQTVVPPPGPPAIVPPPPAAGGAPTDFGAVMQKITGLMSAGKLTQPQVIECCVAAGVENVIGLSKNPTLIPTFSSIIDSMVGA